MAGGFKYAQKILNLKKKENNNKDYRSKEKSNKYKFSCQSMTFDYILRTEYGICLNEKNKNYLLYDYNFYQRKNPCVICFEEHSEEENKIIQQEIIKYCNLGISQLACSNDKTHSDHSKISTKNRKLNRRQKTINFSEWV